MKPSLALTNTKIGMEVRYCYSTERKEGKERGKYPKICDLRVRYKKVRKWLLEAIGMMIHLTWWQNSLYISHGNKANTVSNELTALGEEIEKES